MSSRGGERGESGAADFFGNERFELEVRLGEGAFGVVYQAYDRVRETRVALKVLRSLGPDALFYFKREFRALSDISHANLVRYHELFEERGRWFLTMELVHGVPFVEYVRAGLSPVERSRARFDETRLRAVLPQLSAALVALHAAGKVHRDVKPSNVRVTAAGRLVLLDFGLVLDTETRESTRMPRVGTAAFMAPEQVVGAQVGPSADYYAVGALLYECLTGQHPFTGDPFDVLSEKQVRDPVRPSEVAPFVPPDLDELTMALLAREPGARASGIEALNELAPREPARTTHVSVHGATGRPLQFVGRVRELSALGRLVAELDDGQSRVAFVHGESGVGKSALLGEFARKTSAERPDVSVFAGRCYERETVPFKAFDGVIDQLARHLRRLSEAELVELLPPGVELLAQAFPVLARVPRIRERAARERLVSDRGEGPQARRRAFAALTQLLGRLAARAPVVVTIDDVHRADVDSLGLLEELVAAPDLAVLFVLCGRSPPRRDEVQERRETPGSSLERVLARAPRLLRLRLGALSESDARMLTEALLAQQGAPLDVALTIAREAAGQPLFIASLVHFVGQSSSRSIPTLDEALRASVSALARGTQRLASTIAVAGAPLSRDVLARALREDGDALQTALDEALATRWFRMSSGEDGAGIELVHERIREAIVARLDAGEKRALHRALADALARTSQRAEAAALHFAEAGARDEVVTFARSAAHQALDALAFAKAVRLYELALAHADDEPNEVRSQLSEGLAEALWLDGRAADAAGHFAEAAASVTDERALTLRYRAATCWLSAGEHERGMSELEALLERLGVTFVRSRRALVWSLAWLRLVGFLRGYRVALRGDDEARGTDALRVDALWTLTTALVRLDPLRALELSERHLAAALDLADGYRLARALALEAWLARGMHGDQLLASAELRRARELALASGRPHATALVELVHAFGTFMNGDYRGAIRYADGAESALRDDAHAGTWERVSAALLSLTARFEMGDFRGVSERLHRLGVEGETRSEHPWTLGFATRFVSFMHLLADEPDRARVVIERVRERFGERPFSVPTFNQLVSYAEVDLYVGDPNACARVERAWPGIEASQLLRSQPMRLRALFLRARAALGSGYLMPHQRVRLLALAERQATLMLRSGTEVARAWATLVQAATAELAGERARAISLFGEAALSAETAGMPHYAAVARRRQGALLGGEEGRAAVVRAERALRDEGAVDPARVCAVLLGY